MSAFVVPGKSGKRARAVVVQGGSKAKRSNLAEWSSAIQDAAILAFKGRAFGRAELEAAAFVGIPVRVELTFRLGRPKSHRGSGRNAGKLRDDAPAAPIGTPDIDKLARAALDAMIGVCFDDDSRVVDLRLRKVYATTEGLEVIVGPWLEEFVFAAPDPGENIQGVERTLAIPPVFSDAPGSEILGPANGKSGAMTAAKIASAQSRIRKLIGGTQIESELHAIGKHAKRKTQLELVPPVAEDDFGGPDA